eukprot:Colp12_sorted_trinity150504_noHs@19800
MGFLTSTHRKHWLFASQAELDAKRLKANEEARADIKKLSSKVSDSAFLGAEDEKKFVNYMLQKLKQFCESGLTIPAPPKVVATASTYFKRFYLKNSMMNYDPSDMMFVCVFLACKVEEFFQTLDTIETVLAAAHVMTKEEEEEAKAVYKRLKDCRNPRYDPNSKVFTDLQESSQRQKEEKRKRKLQDHKDENDAIMKSLGLTMLPQAESAVGDVQVAKRIKTEK